MPSMTKGATSFVHAASCNNNARKPNHFLFPIALDPFLGKPPARRRVPRTLTSERLVPDGTFYSPNSTEWIVYL